jgi:class 3 adenylate cyclase
VVHSWRDEHEDQVLERELRTGIHTGERQLRDDDLTGVAVLIAARVCALAPANEIRRTATVRDLVIGLGLHFQEHGTHAQKGIELQWQIVAAIGTRSETA